MPLEAFDDEPGLPVTKTWPVTPMPGSYTTWALRGAPSATHQAQRPCFRIENDQMRAQKPMPLGEKRKQGVKRRLEPTLRPHSCGDALQGFHVRDGIHQTGRRLFRHTNQKRDRPRGPFQVPCAL